MELKLHQLRALNEVVEHGGIRAAARATGASQAALTKALRQLEDGVGVSLLLRGLRGVSLTPAGERVHARAQVILRELGAASRELEQEAEAANAQLHAAISTQVLAQDLGNAYRWFRQRHPRIGLRLVEGVAHKSLPELRSGALDLAILSKDDDFPEDEFNLRPLHSALFVPVVRRNHPVLKNPDLAALARLEWLYCGMPDGRHKEGLCRLFRAAGAAPPQRLVHCDPLVALHLLLNTDAAMFMPQRLVTELGRGEVVPVPQAPLAGRPMTLMLVSRRDRPLAPPAEYFVDCVAQALQGDVAGGAPAAAWT